MQMKFLAIGSMVSALLMAPQAYSQLGIAVEVNPVVTPAVTVGPSTVYEPVTTSYYYPSTPVYTSGYSTYRYSYPTYYANSYPYYYRGPRVVAPYRYSYPTYRSLPRGRWGW